MPAASDTGADAPLQPRHGAGPARARPRPRCPPACIGGRSGTELRSACLD